jgi:hypothetical protein
MIIFPFGFYILDGKTPVYVGNDLEAQNTVRVWKEANPEQVRLCLDMVGPLQIRTTFVGWDCGASRSSMDQSPLLFETVVLRHEETLRERRYSGYDAALAGHAAMRDALAGGGDR